MQHRCFLRNQVLVPLIAALACAGSVQAQSIFTNPITDADPSADNPYTNGQIVDPNITASGIGRGPGSNEPPANAADRYLGNSFDTAVLDPTAYFTFTLTPDAGYEIDFQSFVYTGQTTGQGPTSFAFRSSLDGFTSDIGSPTAGGTTIDLSGATFQNVAQPVEFRLYAFNAGSAGGTFSVDDFTFNGAVDAIGGAAVEPVPEPGTVFGGLALLGIVGYRERKRLGWVMALVRRKG